MHMACALLALCLAIWPTAAACSDQPGKEAPLRLRTPLGTFEMDPEQQRRLEGLEHDLGEAASELHDLLGEKVTLTPEQKARLRELLEQLRRQIEPLKPPGSPPEQT
jgi:hypothetical protein